MAPKPWISTWKPNFAQIGGFFYFGGHSKPTMDINSQHHNLLGNQISPKSETEQTQYVSQTSFGGHKYGSTF
jgi:hypothetical protein